MYNDNIICDILPMKINNLLFGNHDNLIEMSYMMVFKYLFFWEHGSQMHIETFFLIKRV